MSEAVATLGIGLVVVALVGFLYWADRRYPGPELPRETTEAGAFCAWCIYWQGDDCTNPASPVGGQECGQVCIGDLACQVREVRR
jgi:hypothetical protein